MIPAIVPAGRKVHSCRMFHVHMAAGSSPAAPRPAKVDETNKAEVVSRTHEWISYLHGGCLY